MEYFTKMINCFCCYVIKSAGETANNVLLSVKGNPLRIKINLSQIMTFNIKREKVCAVCPYLLLYFKKKLNVRKIARPKLKLLWRS